MTLEEVLGYKPEAALDDYSIRLCDTDFGRYFTCFDTLPENTVLCIRKISSASIFTGIKETEKKHEYHKEMFCAVMNFKSPE